MTTTTLAMLLCLALGLALGLVGGSLLAGRGTTRGRLEREAERAAAAEAERRRAESDAVVADRLGQLQGQLRELGADRAAWQGQLRQQVADVRHTTELLRQETHSLSTALRRPQVRGRWGELHLRRAVELAGLVERCDFDEQVTATDGEGRAQRPDLVVRLAGGRQVVVDSKVPLDAFLDSTETDDEEERLAHLRRHAKRLRAHVDALAAKAYWKALPATPEFVVLFVPGESFLAAALDTDPALLDDAAARRVILATPTTLIALLRTVALGWTQEALVERSEDILRLGRELHERVGVLGAHLDRVGRSLGNAVSAYNQALGSLESRVLVTSRRFAEIGVVGEAAPTPPLVEALPRPPSAAELLGDARSGVEPAPGPASGDPGVAQARPA